ncbi:hypothetical protein GCM10010259_39470 [Streptomyces daghestanicus]|nr:hypothetical protein GCM10010259_39470 [Streptomyces daghestanicus]
MGLRHSADVTGSAGVVPGEGARRAARPVPGRVGTGAGRRRGGGPPCNPAGRRRGALPAEASSRGGGRGPRAKAPRHSTR